MLPNSRGTLDPKTVVRRLRIIFAVMFVSLCLYPYPVVFLRLHGVGDTYPNHTAQTGILAAGMLTGAVVLYLRFVRIPDLFSSAEPTNRQVLAARALTYYILCYVFSEATALFGFVLAFMRADSRYYVPLYIADMLLMVVCYPRLPSSDSI